MLFDEYIYEMRHAQENPGYCNEFTEDICLKAENDHTVSDIQILMIFDERSPFHEAYDSPYEIDSICMNTFDTYSITTPENGRWYHGEYVYHVVPVIDGYVFEPQLGNTPEECMFPVEEYQDMFANSNNRELAFYIADFDEDKF